MSSGSKKNSNSYAGRHVGTHEGVSTNNNIDGIQYIKKYIGILNIPFLAV